MPRCTHCGKVNREGSLFCQDCGHRLEPTAAAPKPAASAGTTCSACGTQNPPGMNFCKMCGTSLAAKAGAAVAVPGPSPALGSAATMAVDTSAPAPAPVQAIPQPVAAAASAPSAPKAICPACGKGTPVGFAFCQHCGQRLSASPGAAAPSVRNAPSPVSAAGSGGVSAQPAPSAVAAQPMGVNTMGVANTVGVVTPTPPAGMPRSGPSPTAPRVAQPANGPVSHGDNANGAFAQTMAPTPANLDQLRAAVQASQPAAQPAPSFSTEQRPTTLPTATAPDLPASPSSHGTLVAVNRDGSDGRAVEMTGDAFDIGRIEGSLNFADDPYLAARHARILWQGGKPILRPLDGVNGVFVRVTSCELLPGDSFLVGKELLRYEPLAPEERDPPSLVEHGVRIFGSVPREAWGRLRQLTIAGTARDVWHLTRPELVLGREEGDVTFPDDEFMSRRHAAVKRVGNKARLEDLGSSNGTFVRVRGDRELKSGDLIRIGDQLLRYEP
jgi:pSer/pThr/pTyr-binding forkhead associated (FHA) protein